MSKVELAVYGASNAAGWSVGHGVAYDISKIAEVSYSRPPFVSETPSKILIDLSYNPPFDEERHVVNAAIPGATLPELIEDFERQVLANRPSQMFFLGGLNDPVLAITMLHHDDPGINHEDKSDVDEELATLISRSPDVDSALQAATGYIVGRIKRIGDLAQQNGITPFLSTLPPFGHTLTKFEYDSSQPLGQHLLKEGRDLVKLINNQIQAFREEAHIVDAFNLVVDPKTGLTKAEYSYGVSVPKSSGDILHLNSFGHIQIATVLCTKLHGKAVEIIPPQRDRLEES